MTTTSILENLILHSLNKTMNSSYRNWAKSWLDNSDRTLKSAKTMQEFTEGSLGFTFLVSSAAVVYAEKGDLISWLLERSAYLSEIMGKDFINQLMDLPRFSVVRPNVKCIVYTEEQ